MDKLDKELMESHLRMIREFRNHFKLASSFSNLSFAQLEALLFINQNSNCTISELAKHFKITNPSATVLVDKLDQESLTRRQMDPEDRRMIRVTLTTKGKDLLKKIIKDRILMMRKVFVNLDTGDKKHLLRIMKKVI